MGFFDDVSDSISDKVGDVVNDAKEAAGDVAEGAGDVASEIGQGDIGGAVDEAQDTVEDVSSGQADTGSNDTSDDNFSSPSPSSGALSSGGSSGGQPSTGGSSTSSSSGPSIGDSSSADSSDSFDSGDDFDGLDSSGGGTSTGSSSGGSSSTRSPKETVKDKVGNQDSLGPQGSKSQSSNSASGMPDTVKGEISRVKSRISDLKKSMEDGTWRAGMKQDIKQKQEYLRELKRKNPNAPIDRTGNVIVSDPDGPGGSEPQKTLGSGDTWAEAEYNARVNTEGNRDFNQASESAIANVAERRAEKAQQRYSQTANELESAKQRIQNDQAENYLINTQNIPQEDLTTLGVSKNASGQVQVSESNLLEYYDQQLSQVRNQIEDAEEQEQRFANFEEKTSQGQGSSQGRSINTQFGSVSTGPDGQLSKQEYKDFLQNRAEQGDIQAELQLAQLNASKGKSRRAKKQELRSLVRENPNLLATGGQFNEAKDQPVKALKSGKFGEFTEDITTGKAAPKEARQRFKELKKELDLTKGQIDTIQGEEAGQRVTNNVAPYFGSENPVVKFGAKGAAGLASIAEEVPEALPNPNRKFEGPGEQQAFDTRTGRTAKTAELTGKRELELGNGETVTVGSEGQPDYSPTLVKNPNEETFSLSEARGVSEARVNELADAFGNAAGGVAALPYEVQRRGGQGQQLASGEMTLQEAKKGTTQAVGSAVTAIKKDPLKAGVQTVPGLITGSAVSKVSKLGKLGKGKSDADFDTNIQAASNKLKQKSQGDVATGEGFAKAKTKVKRPLRQRILRRKGKYKEYETQINSPGIMAFDKSGYAYGRAVTRGPDGDIVNEQDFVASTLRKAPESVEGRVGEISQVGTKLDLADGDTKFIDSNSVIAGVAKGPDYTDIYRQSSRTDTEAEDLTRSRTRVKKQQDKDSEGSGGGTGQRDSGSGDGGVPAGSGGRVELERSRSDADSGDGTNQGSAGSLDQQVLQEIAESNVRQADDVSGGSGAAGAGAGAATTLDASTQEDYAERPGSTGQASGADAGGLDVYTNSPGRVLVGATTASDASGQVIGFGGSSGSAGVGGPGSGVASFTDNQSPVVNLNEERNQDNKKELRSPVVGLGIGLNLPPQAQAEEDKGKGSRGPAASGAPAQGQRQQPSQNQQGQGVDTSPVTEGPGLVNTPESQDPALGSIPIIGNAQSPQERSERMVQNKPGVDRRSKEEVVPQGITDTLQPQTFDQRAVPGQEFRQRQAPRQQNLQKQTNPGDGNTVPASAFGVPGFPGRPRVPQEEEEERRKSENRAARDQFAFGSRMNPIASGTQLLFGQQSSGKSQEKNQKNRKDSRGNKNEFDPFRL